MAMTDGGDGGCDDPKVIADEGDEGCDGLSVMERSSICPRRRRSSRRRSSGTPIPSP